MNDKPLDDKTVYIFIRQDLSLALQLVHVAHGCFHLGMDFGRANGIKIVMGGHKTEDIAEVAGIPFAAIIGMPDLNAMNRVKAKLEANSIALFAWDDPDEAEGMTCIVTEPVARELRESLGMRKYRLWNPDDPTRVLIQDHAWRWCGQRQGHNGCSAGDT